MAHSELFTPLTLRGLTLRNRIALSPMCQYSVDTEDGIPTPWHLVHLGARAQGGFGLLIAEAAAVAPAGRISPRDVGLWSDAQAHAWAQIVDFCHTQSVPVGIQLAHAGRKASTWPWLPAYDNADHPSVPESEGGWQPIGPSAIPAEGHHTPRTMSLGEISGTVADFAEAARRAVNAGFDVIELHCAHGYLVHEFLSPLSNQRTDEYGGSLDKRMRLALEIVEAVRSVLPDAMPLLARISASDWNADGWNIEDSIILTREMTDRGVDLIDVSSGGNVPAPIPARPGYQVPFARDIRRATGAAVGTVGLITEPHQAEQILIDGSADLIFIGRAALREPSWPQKAAFALRERNANPYPPQYARGAWR
ncbi:NADH:flavin oxidoreductase/NADH oxidase [Devriesea agamarum]|uniref:NADH:flavin oxidoreductase/NADH oxidase n=1 Tax=Devriesea agamarum TaxID=472569 RepID=UPI00071E1B7B|nr:NADH:flavin oxidoreductase/NADH oxidase [Devriesea agamarum]